MLALNTQVNYRFVHEHVTSPCSICPRQTKLLTFFTEGITSSGFNFYAPNSCIEDKNPINLARVDYSFICSNHGHGLTLTTCSVVIIVLIFYHYHISWSCTATYKPTVEMKIHKQFSVLTQFKLNWSQYMLK